VSINTLVSTYFSVVTLPLSEYRFPYETEKECKDRIQELLQGLEEVKCVEQVPLGSGIFEHSSKYIAHFLDKILDSTNYKRISRRDLLRKGQEKLPIVESGA